MRCTQCGNEMSKYDRYCKVCGENNEFYVNPEEKQQQESYSQSNNQYNNPAPQQINTYQNTNAPIYIVKTNDSGSIGWGILGFFFPFIGFILFLAWHSDKPKSAKSAGIGALIGFVLYFIAAIV